MKYADLKKGDVIKEYTNDLTIVTYEVYQEGEYRWVDDEGKWVTKSGEEKLNSDFQSVYREGLLIFG